MDALPAVASPSTSPQDGGSAKLHEREGELTKPAITGHRGYFRSALAWRWRERQLGDMPPDQPRELSVPLAPRVILVAVVAAAVGMFTRLVTDPPLFPSDFQFYWRGTALWLSGVDPYTMRPKTDLWPLW